MLAGCRDGTLPGIRWNVTEAESVRELFTHLRQYKGRWAGKPLVLLPWEAFVVQSIFGWQRYDAELGLWVRLYREAYISVGRKNGKTTISAGIALILVDYDDEPAAEVYFAATKRDQARQGYDTAVEIVQQSAELRQRIVHLRATVRLVVPETASVLMPLGRDSDTEHGLNVHGALIDELHVHHGRDMVDALDTGTGSRTQPLLVYTTTAGVEGVSIYTEVDDRARRVLTGVSTDDHLFVYLANLDEGDDWTDERTYIKANPSLGQTLQLADLVAERNKALAIPGRQAAFKRLRLNMRTGAAESWLDIRHWDHCAATALLRTGKRLIGVDLGGRQDLSAAVEVTADEKGVDLRVHCWMPADVVEDREDRDGVPYRAWADEGWLRLTNGDYRDDAAICDDLSALAQGVLEFDIDPWNSTTLTTPLQDRGFKVVVVYPTFPSLSPAVSLFEELLMHGRVQHDGNPLMRWMLTNTMMEQNRDGGRKPIKLDKGKERRHIDGVSALLNALARLPAAVPPEAAQVWGFGAV